MHCAIIKDLLIRTIHWISTLTLASIEIPFSIPYYSKHLFVFLQPRQFNWKLLESSWYRRVNLKKQPYGKYLGLISVEFIPIHTTNLLPNFKVATCGRGVLFFQLFVDRPSYKVGNDNSPDYKYIDHSILLGDSSMFKVVKPQIVKSDIEYR